MSNATKIEGAKAFDCGTKRRDCPYVADTEEFQDWTDGWAQRKAWHEKEAAVAGCGSSVDVA